VDDDESSSSGIPVWPFLVAAVVLFVGGLAVAFRLQRRK
jgi:hypothetical protein